MVPRSWDIVPKYGGIVPRKLGYRLRIPDVQQRVLALVVITKKNCLRTFPASMRVISAMTGNPPLLGA